jgi:hypothetical protein
MRGNEGLERIHTGRNKDKKAKLRQIKIQIFKYKMEDLGKLLGKEEVQHFVDQFCSVINV